MTYSITEQDALTLMASLANQSIAAIITDPPYGQTRLGFDKGNKGKANLCLSPDFWSEVWRVTNMFICTAIHPFTAELVVLQRPHYRHAYVWVKNNPTGFLDANRKPLRIHEDVLVFSNKHYRYHAQMRNGAPYRRIDYAESIYDGYGSCGQRNRFRPLGGRYPTTLLEIPSDINDLKHQDPATHPTQKPVALMEYLITSYTDEGDTVLDPFMGSGTTGVACQRTNRHFIGCDIAPEYVTLAAHRLAKTQLDFEWDQHGFTQLSLFSTPP